jgi:phosphoenolpyruvate-protein kinase (PTS system EI component)
MGMSVMIGAAVGAAIGGVAKGYDWYKKADKFCSGNRRALEEMDAAFGEMNQTIEKLKISVNKVIAKMKNEKKNTKTEQEKAVVDLRLDVLDDHVLMLEKAEMLLKNNPGMSDKGINEEVEELTTNIHKIRRFER